MLTCNQWIPLSIRAPFRDRACISPNFWEAAVMLWVLMHRLFLVMEFASWRNVAITIMSELGKCVHERRKCFINGSVQPILWYYGLLLQHEEKLFDGINFQASQHVVLLRFVEDFLDGSTSFIQRPRRIFMVPLGIQNRKFVEWIHESYHFRQNSHVISFTWTVRWQRESMSLLRNRLRPI